MSSILLAVLTLIAVSVTVVLVSYVVEALRRSPLAPQQLRWAPDVPLRYLEVDGIRIRYIKVGQGPALVLLHTLRTQLDLFEKVVPELATAFTVYAVDYPGHGFSDIPKARYEAQFFADSVEGVLDALDLQGAMLAGVSIGGAISLLIAARRNPRVTCVVAINPYDYAKGRGLARSSFLGWMIMTTSGIPIVGETVMRLRNLMIMKAVFEGGVADPDSIPQELLHEMNLVGNRPGHYRAFISLLRNAASWETATKGYSNIDIPVLLIWGDEDWATPEEKDHDRELVPGAEMVTVSHAGHFLPLDRPDELIAQLRSFHERHTASRVGGSAETQLS